MLPSYIDIFRSICFTRNPDNSEGNSSDHFPYNPSVIRLLYNINKYLTENELEEKYSDVSLLSVVDFRMGVMANMDLYRFDSRRPIYTLLKEYHPGLIRRYDISNCRDNVAIHVDKFNPDTIIKLINTVYNIYRNKIDKAVVFNDLDIADIRYRNRELIYKERIKIEKYPIEDNKYWVDLKSIRFKVEDEYYSLVDFVILIVTNRPRNVIVTYNLIDVEQYNDPLEVTQEEIDTIKRMEEEFLKQQKEIQELSEYAKHKRQSSTPADTGVEGNMPFKTNKKGLVGRFLSKLFKQ